MTVVDANGISICYEDTGGDGDPLLLVMGLGGQLVDWTDEFVDSLVERGFRVIRHDNRDAGLSTEFDWTPPSRRATLAALVAKRPLEVGYRIPDMAQDAVSLLDVLDIESAHVVGASMGGMIAQTMAFEHRRKVKSLTSIMSHTGDRRNGGIDKRVLVKLLRAPEVDRANAARVGTEMYRLWAGSGWDKAAHFAQAERSVARSWRPRGVERQMAAIAASANRTKSLRRVVAPTLVVHGLQDTLVLPSGGIATAKAVPGSRLIMFPDMGHDVPMTRRDELCDAIRVNADRARVDAVSPA